MIEVLTLIMSIIAIGISMFAIKVTKGQVEIELRNMITSSRERYEDILIKFKENKEERLKEVYENILESSLENYLNSYDEACSKYIDNKVDKVRFKKNYSDEIKNNVENFEEKYTQTSRYKATIKVYNEWNNVEKKIRFYNKGDSNFMLDNKKILTIDKFEKFKIEDKKISDAIFKYDFLMEMWIIIISLILTFKVYSKIFSMISSVYNCINSYISLNKIITNEFIKTNINNLKVVLFILLWIILFLIFYLIYYIFFINKLEIKLDKNNKFNKFLNFLLCMMFYLMPVIFIFLEVNITLLGIICTVVLIMIMIYFKYRKESLNENLLSVFKSEINKIFRIDSNKNYLEVKKMLDEEIKNVEEKRFFPINMEEIKEYSIIGIGIASILSIIDKFWDKTFENLQSDSINISNNIVEIFKNSKMQKLINISFFCIMMTITFIWLLYYTKIKLIDKALLNSKKNKLKRMKLCLEYLEQKRLDNIPKNKKMMKKLNEISSKKYSKENIIEYLSEKEKNKLNNFIEKNKLKNKNIKIKIEFDYLEAEYEEEYTIITKKIKVINKKEDIILKNKNICFFTNGKLEFDDIEKIIKIGIKNRK